MVYRLKLALIVMFFSMHTGMTATGQELLESSLKKRPSLELAQTAMKMGDAQRGALLFYQPNMNCAKCHEPQGDSQRLGPDLTKKRDVKVEHLVNSLLRPSETIHEGFETAVVQTDDGLTLSGVLTEKTEDAITLARIESLDKPEVFALDDIDWKVSKLSTMPEGLANQLADEQQFFDLVQFLSTIARDGPARAAQLRPASALVSLPPLPAYESRIDHRGMVGSWNQNSLKRGESIFSLHCASCHGTVDKEGSMPTSLRFASGKFKSGSDPYAMYQTLSHGYGMMNAQRWMVPEQKYDVIHFIRESFIKEHNPSEYFPIDEAYLAGLPKGNTRGPKPASGEPWVKMDYGSSLMNTIEVSRDGTNIAQKGIIVRLDEGPGGVANGRHWLMYEHDTMRVAAAWSGSFIDWNGIHFNGRHAVHPRITGQVHFANSTGPGWANPLDGSFVDNRIEGRDGKRYGPLDKDWIHYQGMHRYADRSIISYSVGNSQVMESPAMLHASETPVFSRQLNIGPRDRDLVLQIAEIGDNTMRSIDDKVAILESKDRATANHKEANDGDLWQLDGSMYAQWEDGKPFDMHNQDFTISARIRTTANGTIFCKTKNWAEWVPDGKSFFIRGGRLVYDIGWVGAVRSRRKVNDGEWHDIAMTWSAEEGEVTFFVDGRRDASGTLKANEEVSDHAIRIGYTNEDFPDPSFFEGNLTQVRFYQRLLTAEELSGKVQPIKDSLRVDWQLARDGKLIDSSGAKRNAEVIWNDTRTNVVNSNGLMVAVSQSAEGVQWKNVDGRLRLIIPAGETPLRFTLFHCPLMEGVEAESLIGQLPIAEPTLDLSALTHGGPKNWPEVLETQASHGSGDGPFAVDVLTEPRENPWNCRVRLTGVDFLAGGNEAVCSAWDGSVWHVSGINDESGRLKWRRIAAGLFQPLGIKIRDGELFVTCRDQLVRLHDLNGDGEMDWYENFNSDHQVTEHFHEFAMGLQTDDDGNFYYAKSARHALKAIVPHHGTLLKVDASGASTEILANGFRAANGVCLNPDGTFYVTDQEGHWNPKNRINWVQKGGFYGNMFGYHDVTDDSDEAMDPPMCWITNSFDRSPSELMWVESEKWGPLKGSLLNFSYGYGQVYVVPHEKIDGQVQGGMCAFPLPRFPTGVMRGRFHPTDGQLYCCGMFAWAGDQHRPGGFYRIRYTGAPVHLPTGLNADESGLKIRFSDKVDRESATNPDNFKIKTWTIKRTSRYGSNHFDEKELSVKSVQLNADGDRLSLEIPEIETTRCMEVVYSIKTEGGKKLEGKIHNTIHRLANPK